LTSSTTQPIKKVKPNKIDGTIKPCEKVEIVGTVPIIETTQLTTKATQTTTESLQVIKQDTQMTVISTQSTSKLQKVQPMTAKVPQVPAKAPQVMFLYDRFRDLPKDEPERTLSWVGMPNIVSSNPNNNHLYLLSLYKIGKFGAKEIDRTKICLGVYQYKRVKDAKEDLMSIILSVLNVVVERYDLWNEETRKEMRWCSKFEDIFQPYSEDHSLDVKDHRYPVKKLINLLIQDFLGFRLEYDIVKMYKVDETGKHEEDSDYELDNEEEEHCESYEECEKRMKEEQHYQNNPFKLVYKANLLNKANHFL
jgi:hypothetical protein